MAQICEDRLVEPYLAMAGFAPGLQPPFANADVLFDLRSGPASLPSYSELRLPAGHLLAQNGQTPHCVLILVGGIARVRLPSGNLILDTPQWLKADDVIGLAEALERRPFSYDVTASSNCTVRAVEASEIVAYLFARPERSYIAIRMLAGFILHTRRALKESRNRN